MYLIQYFPPNGPGGPLILNEEFRGEDDLQWFLNLCHQIQKVENSQPRLLNHQKWMHLASNSSNTEMALVALKASLKQNHLQMTSNGSENCSNGSRRSKRSKIHQKNVKKGFP
jgi:hypothetical protein